MEFEYLGEVSGIFQMVRPVPITGGVIVGVHDYGAGRHFLIRVMGNNGYVRSGLPGHYVRKHENSVKFMPPCPMEYRNGV